MATIVGKFTIDGDTVTGPALYLEQRGNALLDAIQAGDDLTFNLTSQFSPDIETAVLVRLQTDYAGWLGQRQLLRQLGG